MLTKHMKRIRNGERGFSLVELMVVVLIIAILLAVAIPTFLGARSKAQDRSAQSSLRNAVVSAKVIYADASSYVGATTTAMTATEPSLTFLTASGVSDSPKKVSITGTATTFKAAALSDSGSCFYIQDVSGVTTYGTGTAANCSAANASFTATLDKW